MIEVQPSVELIYYTGYYGPMYYGYKQCVSWDPCDKLISADKVEAFLRKRMHGCHDSPLEHNHATFQVTCSRACSHQLVRHRLASYSQMSQRYCVDRDGDIRAVVPPSVKAAGMDAVNAFREFINAAYDGYQKAMELYKIPAEDARFLLPTATATRLIVTKNYRDLIDFIGKRTCSRAQWEIRDIANQMLAIMKDRVPCIFEHIGRRCEQNKGCPEEDGYGCGWYAKHIKEEESK